MSNNRNEYIILFATSGVGLTKITERIKTEFNAEVVDIEEGIKKDPKIKKALQNIKAIGSDDEIDMEKVTCHIPRLKILNFWNESVARCLDQLQNSPKSVKILSGHIIYYSNKRQEFYMVPKCDNLFLKKGDLTILKPKCVLLLIDDIFDMYYRLPDLYLNQIEDFIFDLERKYNYNVKHLQKDRLSSLIYGWEVRNLFNLLLWRNFEVISAENLAMQLNARFLVWPVKQVNNVLELWLKNPKSTAIYLSHRITDVRNERSHQQSWPTVTKEVNQLQKLLSDVKITLVAPTSIDELRFHEKNRQYNGTLDPRWPMVSHKTLNLLYFKPSCVKDIHHIDILKPKYWDHEKEKLSILPTRDYTDVLRCEINAFLQTFIREIEAQISSRDFLFIYHTKGLFVYRPYYGDTPKPTFSRGVDAEVKLWEELVQLGARRYIAFIHFETDIKQMLYAKSNDIFEHFRDELQKLLSPYNVSKDHVTNMIRYKGKIAQLSDILNKTNITGPDKRRLKNEFTKYFQRAKIELLKKYLTNTILPDDEDREKREELIGIWVLTNWKTVVSEKQHIAGFLRNGKPKGNQWETNIDRLFPDSSILTYCLDSEK